MGLISYLKDALDIGPKGPVYDVNLLESSQREYWLHVDRSRELVSDAIRAQKRFMLDVKPGHDELCPSELLGKIQFTWKWNVNSWLDDVFIKNVKRFVRKNANAYPSETFFRRCVSVRTDHPLDEAEDHRVVARSCANDIVSAITFFLCDERSPFDTKASMDDGACSTVVIARRYACGRDIVKSNFDRIDTALSRCIAYARDERRVCKWPVQNHYTTM